MNVTERPVMVTRSLRRVVRNLVADALAVVAFALVLAILFMAGH